MKRNKKAQAWGIDLIVGVIIFSIGVLIFFIYSINHSGEAKESLEGLSYEGNTLFSNILSEGYPKDWNESNVIEIGILDNNKINETKLERFYYLSKDNYKETKSIFNTRYDYYFSFENMTINSSVIQGIGNAEINLSSINATNLLKITRFSIYEEKPTTVYLYIWEE